MDLWIVISIAAALFQTVRFMLQKQLSLVQLSAAGATFARFVYSAPILCALLAVWLGLGEARVALPTAGFWAYGAIGGAAQITATVLTVLLFKRRNFAVGVTFIKVEVVMTALVGMVVLGDKVSLPGLAAILIGVAGVLVLSGPQVEGNILNRLITPSAALGLAAGALFGVSAVSYRGASLLVAAEDPFLRALVTLAAVTTMQTLAMAVWLVWREAGEIGRVFGAWTRAGWIGLTSMAGSFCWFTAFTLQNAAYVKAVGQVELIFAVLGSVLFFRERITRREWIGMALLSASILGLVLLL
ncbi:DMT family transporter [Shimia sp. FJ5]|uniref:DMT family transporter n=1 Tax=Shimia sp. FJ5 TaxID=3079054 RepID=UPI00260AD8B0|nr:DMT family transporter [Shimia sp. FJ5]MDV4143626.1 DMT family transporter [Shimia sp. FJ5]